MFDHQNLKKSENMTNQMKISLMKMRIIEVDNTLQKLDACISKSSSRPESTSQT
jgi:hypothetical protein